MQILFAGALGLIAAYLGKTASPPAGNQERTTQPCRCPKQKMAGRFQGAERIAVGVAASGGLITAACISGLPSASCTAMAQTYERAIGDFGVVALISLFAVGVMVILPSIEEILKPPWPLQFIGGTLLGYGMTLLACLAFLGSALAANHNSIVAAYNCYIGTDDDLKARLHKRIQLSGPFDWKLWDSSHRPVDLSP